MVAEDFKHFLVLHKPKGITSFDCVLRVRKLLAKRIRIGHAGTLDDFAEGLLIICLGRAATCHVETLMDAQKEYVVKVKLGELTDSLDLTGTCIAQQDDVTVSHEDMQCSLEQFGDGYYQIPPVYSALKFEGAPLYGLAREKIMSHADLTVIAARRMRWVSLYEKELVLLELPYATFRFKVSKGTYVRSLAHDVAQKVGLAATTYELMRTKIGGLSLRDAVSLGQLKTADDVMQSMLSFDQFKTKIGIVFKK